jgi:plastocyanin
MRRWWHKRRRLLGWTLVALTGCGRPATVPSSPPVSTLTVTLTAATGATPRDILVPLGSRVLFINNDARSHNMTSDPHPEHNDCPDINQVGFLLPGERRETGNLVIARVCGFHDHDSPEILNLHGTITIK